MKEPKKKRQHQNSSRLRTLESFHAGIFIDFSLLILRRLSFSSFEMVGTHAFSLYYSRDDRESTLICSVLLAGYDDRRKTMFGWEVGLRERDIYLWDRG